MQTLYHKIRSAITSAFPDNDLKTELTPKEDPKRYECRLAINSGTPFAIHLCNDVPGGLMLSIFPAVFKKDHADRDIFEIFRNKGVQFTTDDSESFMISKIPGEDNLSVFHLTNTEDSVDEYIPLKENVLIANILAAPTRINKKDGGMDSGG